MTFGMFMIPVNDHRRDVNTLLREEEQATVAGHRCCEESWIGERCTTLNEPLTCPFMFLSNLIAHTRLTK